MVVENEVQVANEEGRNKNDYILLKIMVLNNEKQLAASSNENLPRRTVNQCVRSMEQSSF